MGAPWGRVRGIEGRPEKHREGCGLWFLASGPPVGRGTQHGPGRVWPAAGPVCCVPTEGVSQNLGEAARNHQLQNWRRWESPHWPVLQEAVPEGQPGGGRLARSARRLHPGPGPVPVSGASRRRRG